MAAPQGHEAYNINGEGGRPGYSDVDIEKFGDELLVWMHEDDSRVWLKDFFIEKGINKTRRAEWAKENERFRYSYEIAKDIQESRIFKGAMVGVYKENISKFCLVNNHEWVSEKSETKLSSDSVNSFACFLRSIDGNSKDLIHDDNAK